MKRCVISVMVAIAALFGSAGEARSSDFAAILVGANEVPPVVTPGFGLADFSEVFFGSYLLTIRLEFNLSSPRTGAHLHMAPQGQNGPIVLDFANGSLLDIGYLTINLNSASDLEGPLAGATLERLTTLMGLREIYINVHTEVNPGGEIRCQPFPTP